MRILKSQDWKFEGKGGGHFRFSDRREALEGGTLLLTRSAKYVESEYGVVLMLEWIEEGDEQIPTISLTFDSMRRIMNKQTAVSIEEFEGYILSFMRQGINVGPVLAFCEAVRTEDYIDGCAIQEAALTAEKCTAHSNAWSQHGRTNTQRTSEGLDTKIGQ